MSEQAKTEVPKDPMREAFEEWADDYGHNLTRCGPNPRYYAQDECNDSWAAWQAALATQPQAPQGGVTDLFAKLGAAIKSQDNRATDAPIFIVQQKRSYVTEDDYNQCRYEWHETESGDHCGPSDDEELEQMEKFFRDEGHEPKGWRRLAMMDVWEFVTACFTEQGCKDFIAINGHNLKEPRIYAEGSYRNEEFRSIRKALIDLAPTETPEAGK